MIKITTTQLFTVYIWIAFIEFIVLVGLEAFVNYLRKKNPQLGLSTIDFTNLQIFCFSLLWPRQLLDVVFKGVLKPLFKKRA